MACIIETLNYLKNRVQIKIAHLREIGSYLSNHFLDFIFV